MADDHDDLDQYLAEQLQDPVFAGAYQDAQVRSALLATCVRLRKDLGYTQAQVAQRMETTQSAVSDLEAGATDPQLSTLQRYARAFGSRLEITVTGPAGTGTDEAKPEATSRKRRRSAA